MSKRTWRDAIAALSEEEKRSLLESLEEDWAGDIADIEAMSEEQLTLYLARNGMSPEDHRRGLERFMAKLKEPRPPCTACNATGLVMHGNSVWPCTVCR